MTNDERILKLNVRVKQLIGASSLVQSI